VDTSGIITTVAGVGTFGYSGDGGPATQAQLNWPTSVAVDNSGNLYVQDTDNHRIRKVDTSGIITTIAGNGSYGYSGDGGPSIEAKLYFPDGIALNTAGDLYMADYYSWRIRKVAPPSGFAKVAAAGDITFAEENGLGYVLNSAGRHKTTIDLDAGAALFQFGYDQNNYLSSMTDRFGNSTTVQRNASGIPNSITSPEGVTTTFTIDSNNHLTRITYPDGNFYSFEYTPDGLMTAKIEPKGNRFEYVFNSSGRLTNATDQEGGHWEYSRVVYEKW
jgi:YD repeat-containing protein